MRLTRSSGRARRVVFSLDTYLSWRSAICPLDVNAQPVVYAIVRGRLCFRGFQRCRTGFQKRIDWQQGFATHQLRSVGFFEAILTAALLWLHTSGPAQLWLHRPYSPCAGLLLNRRCCDVRDKGTRDCLPSSSRDRCQDERSVRASRPNRCVNGSIRCNGGGSGPGRSARLPGMFVGGTPSSALPSKHGAMEMFLPRMPDEGRFTSLPISRSWGRSARRTPRSRFY
jgi:hypothetical protein